MGGELVQVQDDEALAMVDVGKFEKSR